MRYYRCWPESETYHWVILRDGLGSTLALTLLVSLLEAALMTSVPTHYKQTH